jgi:hypothetical protein
MAVHNRGGGPTQCGTNRYDHEGARRVGCKPNVGRRMLGAGLSRQRSGKAPESLPSSRTGENPPYGMIGGIEDQRHRIAREDC